MKHKAIQLTIDNPCQVGREHLSPEGRNWFCASCQKTVVDFTSMTDTEIVQYVQQLTGKSVCGDFFTDQLDRPILMPLPSKKYRVPTLLGKAAAMLLLVQSVGNALLAQTTHKSNHRESHAGTGEHKKKSNKVKKCLLIRGVVVGWPKEDTVKGIIVRAVYHDTAVSAITDSAGRFVINIADITGIEKITVSCVDGSSANNQIPTDAVVNPSHNANEEVVREAVLDPSLKPNQEVVLYIRHKLLVDKYREKIAVKGEDIKRVGLFGHSDLSPLSPGIYQSRRGADTAVQPPPQPKMVEKRTFWQRITRPFRRVKK